MKKKRRNHKKSSINLGAIFKAFSLGVVTLVIIGTAYFISKIFTVEIVSCNLTTGDACPESLTQSVSSLKGTPMFFTDYEQILLANQVLSQPYSLASISKSLPSTLQLTFTPEQPLVLLKQMDSLHVISTTGKSFPQSEETALQGTLITLKTDQPIITGSLLESDVLTTIKTILASNEEFSLQIEQITWLDKSTIRLSMKDREEIAIIDSESPRLELQRLALVSRSSEYQQIPESKQELDLRFTMPVLRTAQ